MSRSGNLLAYSSALRCDSRKMANCTSVSMHCKGRRDGHKGRRYVHRVDTAQSTREPHIHQLTLTLCSNRTQTSLPPLTDSHPPMYIHLNPILPRLGDRWGDRLGDRWGDRWGGQVGGQIGGQVGGQVGGTGGETGGGDRWGGTGEGTSEGDRWVVQVGGIPCLHLLT